MTDAFNLEGGTRSTAVVFDQRLDPRESGRNKQRGPQQAQVRSLERPQGAREVVLHPKVDSDLDDLPQRVQDTFHERVESLRNGERHSSTHPLNGQLKGWHGTSVGGNQYRMIHRYADGDLQVLSVGNHDEAYKTGIRRAVAMGQAGPDYDNLSFVHMTGFEYGAHPSEHHHELLFAKKPDHFGYLGHIHYEQHPDRIEIHNMQVKPEHQRRGVASQLMDELERRHPDKPIDHGMRSPSGTQWAKDFYGHEGPALNNGSQGWTVAPKTKNHMLYEGMGQRGPDYDNLTFHVGEHPLYPADQDFQTLFAHHPDHGDIGRLTYRVMDHPPGWGMPPKAVHVTMMHVEPDHTRRGVASQLMNHLENHLFKNMPIEHGDRRPEGNEWAKTHYNDPQGGKEKPFTGEYGGAKSTWTMNGRPINPETMKPRRMPKRSSLYTVRLEHSKRDESGKVSPEGPVVPPHLKPAGISHVRVEVPAYDEHCNPRDWDEMDQEARNTAVHMTTAPGDMVTKADIIHMEAAIDPAVRQDWYHGGILEGGRTLHDKREYHPANWLHVGTEEAAKDRIDPREWDAIRGEADWIQHARLYRARLAPGTRVCPVIHHETYKADREDPASFSFDPISCGKGWDAHRYVNDVEHKGSISMVVRPHKVQSVEDLGRHPAWKDPEVNRSLIEDSRADSEWNRQQRTGLLAHFIPHLRVFTHTCGLDHRLWNSDEKLKPEVRSYILHSITVMWSGKYKDWSKWAKIYFAGSEASEWTSDTLEGNNDFDVLIGVDYAKFRQANPGYDHLSNLEITDLMNQGFRDYNGPTMLTIDGVEYGPFDRTTYVNVGFDDHGTYDLRVIKPYAAYDVGADKWLVKPPHLPHWSLHDLPDAVQKVLRATDSLARRTLKLPEPERTQQGAALFDAWHTDRSRAFGPNGEGWYDIANLREKWLDQSGLWAQIVDCKHRFNEGLGAAPVNWSNDPKTAIRLYRGEGTHDRPSPYVTMGKPELAGSFWTKDRKEAEGYAESARDGKVYQLDAEDHEAEGPYGNHYVVRDPQVRARRVEAAKMMRPSDLDSYEQRDDLDQPHHKPKIDELRSSIINNGYDPNWGDPITVGQGPNGPVVTNGNKRLKVLRDLGYDWPIPVHKTSGVHEDDWYGDLSVDIASAAAHLMGHPRGWVNHHRDHSQRALDTAHHLINSATYRDIPLYSGHVNVHTTLKPDDHFTIPLMAATRSKESARDFAEPAGPGSEPTHVIYEFPKGAHATEIHPDEHVVTGTYRVHAVEPHRIELHPLDLNKTASVTTDRLNEIGRREHPNVDHYQSGGMGHLEGDESRSVVGFVPTHMLYGFEGNETSDRDTVKRVRDDIKQGKGITNPLMMIYDHKNRWAYLGEGNHRLEGATEGGARTVPLRVVRGDASYQKERGIGKPLHMPEKWHGGRGEPYVPSDIHPHHFLHEGQLKTAAPWFDQGDIARPRPKSVRRAGFKGFVADKSWIRDHVDGPYATNNPADVPDHIDDHLSHFVTAHAPNWSVWDQHGEHGNVDLSKGVYATQSHVSQYHIDRYKRNPKATPWAMKDDPDPIHTDDYPGHYHPMFVTHQGRLHAIEGHHRVGAALQQGEGSIEGLHYNLDEHPIVTNRPGHECPTCRQHASESHAEPQTAPDLGPSTPAKVAASDRLSRAYGSNDLNTLFSGDSPATPVPWPQAGKRKTRHTYDQDLVARSISHPHEFQLEDVDPRKLTSTQPHLLRAGVQHYLEGREGGRTYGEDNGADRRLGNDHPRVYHRVDDDSHIILSGHHRAAASLLKGEPLKAIVIHGGWGPER